MKYLLEKDKTKRSTILEQELLIYILKSFRNNTFLKNSIRLNSTLFLFNLYNNSFKSRCVNRCIITSRKSKIHKKYFFSRIRFLNIVRRGYLSGIKKASW